MAQATSGGSDKPAHTYSLIRAFANHTTTQSMEVDENSDQHLDLA